MSWVLPGIDKARELLADEVEVEELREAGDLFLNALAEGADLIEAEGEREGKLLLRRIGLASAFGDHHEGLDLLRTHYLQGRGRTFAEQLQTMRDAGAEHEARHEEIEQLEIDRKKAWVDLANVILVGTLQGARVALPFLLAAVGL